MTPSSLLRRAAHFALTAPQELPAAFDFPLVPPQQEVAVWLHGLGEPRDVTANHAVACPIPFTLCIGLEDGSEVCSSSVILSIRLVERAGNGRLLGEIWLHHQQVVAEGGLRLHLFRATSYRNYCFSAFRDWTRSVYARWRCWKSQNEGKLAASPLDSCCNEVIFSCPRPIVLVSLRQGCCGNLFPMNLMGQIGTDKFVFALNARNRASQNLRNVRELAVCTVPLSEAEQVRQLGRNHYGELIEWNHFAFVTAATESTLNIPVPDFVLTSTELQLESDLLLGSHIFFVARIVGKQTHKLLRSFIAYMAPTLLVARSPDCSRHQYSCLRAHWTLVDTGV